MAAAAVQAELKHDTWTLAAVAYRRFHPGYSPEQTLVIRLLDSTTGDPVDEYSAPLSDLATP